MEREAKFQDDLKNTIEKVAEKYKFDGLEITSVERDYPIDRKEADIALFLWPNTFFMLIETKPKGIKKKGKPSDRSPLGQVSSYAAIIYSLIFYLYF